MRRLLFAAPLACSLVAAVVASGQPGRAADIGDLDGTYMGFAHHNTVSSGENANIQLTDIQTQSNGKFSGIFGGVPVSGKVTGTGKVTFSGSTTTPINAKMQQGKAQLSATGRFLVGSFVLQASGGPAPNGKYTFSIDRGVIWTK